MHALQSFEGPNVSQTFNVILAGGGSDGIGSEVGVSLGSGLGAGPTGVGSAMEGGGLAGGSSEFGSSVGASWGSRIK